MTYELTGNDLCLRLCGPDQQEYGANDLDDAINQLRADLVAMWPDDDEVAGLTDRELASMLMLSLVSCREYAESRGVAVPTVTLHARKLELPKRHGGWLFTPHECERLDKSIVGKRGRPPKA